MSAWKAYAWWAMQENQGLSAISLGDSPDFLGEIPIKRREHKKRKFAKVAGDIGNCSMLAFYNGFTSLAGFHSVWISVLSEERQILIEFGYNPQEWHLRRLFGNQLSRKEKSSYDPKEELRKISYCEECKTWSLTNEGRMRIGNQWKDEINQDRRATEKPTELPNSAT